MTMTMTITAPADTTQQERWAAAVKRLRAHGVAVRQNVQSCCRSCAEPFKRTRSFDAATTPYAWTFGGQGDALRWIDGEGRTEQQLQKLARRRWYHSQADLEPTVVYFNHGNGAGELVADAFRAEGFDVEWDGTEMQCVMVTV